MHAPNYDDLLYLYHPDTNAQLPGLRQDMLDLFNTPRLRWMLRQRGLDWQKARQAFQDWLDTGVRTYDI